MMVFWCVNAAPIDYQLDLYTSWRQKWNLQASTTLPPSTPLSPIHWILFPLLFPLVGCPTGTSLSPCECVASPSDSPPINRYSTLSPALTLPDVNVIYLCCLPLVWLFWVQTWQNIQQPCIFLCWFLMHVLRITCPFGWRGCVVFLFQCSLYYLIPPSILSLSHPILVITIWVFVFGLSGVGLIVHLCAALSVSSICHIYCTSMQFSDGVEKNFINKHFIWNSRHLTLLFQKWRAEKQCTVGDLSQ